MVGQLATPANAEIFFFSERDNFEILSAWLHVGTTLYTEESIQINAPKDWLFFTYLPW